MKEEESSFSPPSMIAEEELNKPAAEELRRLLRETQKLPAAKVVSEDHIAEEIAEYRAGR